MKVIWEQNALDAIHNTYDYIRQFSPANAMKFASELVQFGNSLGAFPLKFRICSKSALKKRGCRCVTFHNHIFAYTVNSTHVSILKVFHAKQNPKKLSVS